METERDYIRDKKSCLCPRVAQQTRFRLLNSSSGWSKLKRFIYSPSFYCSFSPPPPLSPLCPYHCHVLCLPHFNSRLILFIPTSLSHFYPSVTIDIYISLFVSCQLSQIMSSLRFLCIIIVFPITFFYIKDYVLF